MGEIRRILRRNLVDLPPGLNSREKTALPHSLERTGKQKVDKPHAPPLVSSKKWFDLLQNQSQDMKPKAVNFIGLKPLKTASKNLQNLFSTVRPPVAIEIKFSPKNLLEMSFKTLVNK